MCFRSFLSLGLAALVVAGIAGCKKSDSAGQAAAQKTVLRLHWFGKQRLAADTNAAAFLEIWAMPESARMEAQTLDKLALAPWRLLKDDAATNVAPVQLLRPLLDDLVRQEFYLEVRAATNQPAEGALAVRLDQTRAEEWESAAAVIAESLAGVRPTVASGRRAWTFKHHGTPRRIEFARAGEWTLVGWSAGSGNVFKELLARIQRDRAPALPREADSWLEADVDVGHVARFLGINSFLPKNLPGISLTMHGEGNVVVTRGLFHFAQPLASGLESWTVPTNLVRDPLISFTAVRGVEPWLGALKFWNDLQLGPPPGQAFFWALGGIPTLTYCAAPSSSASNQVLTVATHLAETLNPWMHSNGWGSIKLPADSQPATWSGAPFMSPFLKAADDDGRDFVFAGLFPPPPTNPPPPDELINELFRQSNLIYYDWELTGPRLAGWMNLSQLFRLLTFRAQLPPESAATGWLKAAVPKLGNTVTAVTQTGGSEFSLLRRSHVGFSTLELIALADWLESPQFPRGTHTTLVPEPPIVQQTSP